jgi:hypothetical protein
MRKSITMNSTEPTHPRNHHVIHLGDGTALLSFESRCGNQSRIPQITRFYRAPREIAPMNHGRVFGAGEHGDCCLVIRATAGDLIAIAEPRHQDRRLDWVYYVVDDNCVPTFFERSRKMGYLEIRQFFSDSLATLSDSMELTDGMLRILFQASQPSWLACILNVQLADWKLRDPAAFANFTPKLPDPADLDRCVSAAPRCMLERWMDLLDEQQLAKCVGLSPEGAVRYALDRIPNRLLEDYLIKHAAIALDHCRARLSGPDWAACASALPTETFKLRMTLPSHEQAYILATVYQILWRLPFANPSTGERMEILESIREHPDVWLTTHEDSFGQMFAKLERFARIRPNHDLIHALMHHEDEAVRRKILESIPALI